MAASGDGKGKFEFVEQLPEDFTCLVCLDAVYDAVEAKCCGVPLCKPCFDRLTASMMGCPQCRVSPFAANEVQFLRRKVRQLHIYCVNKDCCSQIKSLPFPVDPNAVDAQEPLVSVLDHCMWSGEINDLQSHLDNHCPHTTVTCQYDCGVKIARCHKDVHEAEICHKRPFSCWFCRTKATAEVIHGHATGCDKRPIECPNKCPANLIQGELQLHLQQCPLQKISCEFEHAACKEKVLRKYYDSHIEDNAQKHLRLVSAQLAALEQKVIQENEQHQVQLAALEQKLVHENKQHQVQLVALEQKVIHENEQHQVQLAALEQKLIHENEQHQVQLATLRQENKELAAKKIDPSLPQLPVLRSLADIIIHVPDNGASDPFYVLGYCMSVRLLRLASYLCLQPGRYDDIISWPLEGVVTLLVLHPKDSSKNEEWEYHIDKTQRPTKSVTVRKRYYGHIDYLTNNECRLSVKSAIFT